MPRTFEIAKRAELRADSFQTLAWRRSRLATGGGVAERAFAAATPMPAASAAADAIPARFLRSI